MQHTVTHCNILQRTATQCNALQHTAPYCNTLHYTVTVQSLKIQCYALQHTAKRCNTLQHTAPYCNEEQHTATHRNTLQLCRVSKDSTLQHTAAHCNSLQHTATHCIFSKVKAMVILWICVVLKVNLSKYKYTHIAYVYIQRQDFTYTLQHTVPHRNTQQHTATYCNHA